MEDQNVIERINELAHEEHELFQKASTGGLDPKQHERLRSAWTSAGTSCTSAGLAGVPA